MKIVVQRSKAAKVIVNQDTVGEIDKGLVLLVGVTHEDTEQDAQWLADKIAGLRIFEDEQEKMNFSVQDIGGAILSVSQFTLFGDCRKGRRPNFMAAARPEQAEQLYEFFNECLRKHDLPVSTGIFGAMMDVQFTNWGPVTLILDSQSR
ncbi:D-aminoacyl-tRNA deacylase [Paenibacillus sp. UMB4589-SE434]|uniref:D-aminoacyl-tRNA deacylase n=1 Tax=Paenibacillus sp. UMB4589-SE434 TaxID=3046314 RepID=UPI00254A623D|nr:D-aminoacyl-tRNA deacylase [Paenibacillus sp. UMB4589-SE434]MDK8181162.1 D-aminoacyl-tRNA deacylase [Paenibacillus sp. UMB4589-SE434]